MPRTRTKAPEAKGPKGTPRKPAASASLPLEEASLEDVWRTYKKTASDELRNFLIEQYLPLVKSTAERMHMRLPGEVDVEDLM